MNAFIDIFRITNLQNSQKKVKDVVSLTLTLGWKNEKQPSGPIELDLEAGNLVALFFYIFITEFASIKLVCASVNI